MYVLFVWAVCCVFYILFVWVAFLTFLLLTYMYIYMYM